MSSVTSGGVRLDMAVYIGICVDVALAILAGVLIYWWRRRRSDEVNERRKISNYMVAQRESVRTEMSTIRMTSENDSDGIPNEEHKQVNAVVPVQRSVTESKEGKCDAERVAGNFAFLNSQLDKVETRNEPTDGNSLRRSRVTFTDLNDEKDQEGEHYPMNSDEKVVQNPLSGSVRQHNRVSGLDEDPDSVHSEVAVSTYYTYTPDNQPDDSGSPSDEEKSPPSPTSPPPPPPQIMPDPVEPETGSEVESQFVPPPPSPLPCDSDESGGMVPNPLYEAADTISDGKSDAESDVDCEVFGEDAKSCFTKSFGEEDVAKLYKTELDESTDIM